MQSDSPDTTTTRAASAVARLTAKPKGNADPLHTEAEAAEYIGVAPKTLSVWRSTKRYHLPYVKVGSRVRYRRSDLDAFIASRTQGGEVSE